MCNYEYCFRAFFFWIPSLFVRFSISLSSLCHLHGVFFMVMITDCVSDCPTFGYILLFVFFVHLPLCLGCLFFRSRGAYNLNLLNNMSKWYRHSRKVVDKYVDF